MKIIYSDEAGRLTPEITEMMREAALKAIGDEFFPDKSDPESFADITDIEIGVTVVESDEMRDLNREYRGRDSVTDVLSFPLFNGSSELLEAVRYSGDPEVEQEDYATDTVLMGDVVLCYDRALSQAEDYGTGITRELVYLFVHSILHLMGYDHEDEDERREMRAFEEKVMTAVGAGR